MPRNIRTEWDETLLNDSTNILSKSTDGRSLTCRCCSITIRARRLYGPTEWNNHVLTLGHERKAQARAPKMHSIMKWCPGAKEKEASAAHSNQDNSNTKTTTAKTADKTKTDEAECRGVKMGDTPSTRMELYMKYGMQDEEAEASDVVLIHYGKNKVKMVSKNCSKRRRVINGKAIPCVSCDEYDTRNLRRRIKRAKIIEDVLRELDGVTITETGRQLIEHFKKTPSKFRNEQKSQLLKRCDKFLEHVKWADNNRTKLESMGVMENGVIKCNKLICDFGKLYQDDPHFRDSLLCGLLQCVLSRYKGHVNAKANTKMIAFCQLLHAMSPKMYTVFRQNLVGYNERTLRRHASLCRPPSIIFNITTSQIEQRVKQWMESVKASYEANNKSVDNNQTFLIAISTDATKIPAKIEYCEPHKVWVGGVHPDHIIGKDDFNPNDAVNTTMAREIEVGLAALQNPPEGTSPFKFLGARPQTTNEPCEEYNQSLLDAVSTQQNLHVVAISFDGLSTKTNFIETKLIAFMHGLGNTVGNVDPNHAAKSLRSQLVLGCQVTTAGNCLFDTGLFRQANIAQDLYRVRDYASDLTVLKLCSANTIEKLCRLLGQEQPLSILGTTITIYFLRMFLTAWNADNLPCTARTTMLWCCVMWFNNMNGINKITLHNLTSLALAGIFLCVQKQITKLRHCTTEPLEHQFGMARCFKREFTARDFALYTDKLELIFNHATKHDFKLSASTKGYMAGFEGFLKTIQKIKTTTASNFASNIRANAKDLDQIDVDYSKPIAPQIEYIVIETICETQAPMLHLMSVLGFDIHESPFNQTIHDLKHLARLYKENHDIPCEVEATLAHTNESIDEEEIPKKLAEAAKKLTLHDDNIDSDDEDEFLKKDAHEVLDICKHTEDVDEPFDRFNVFHQGGFYDFLRSNISNDSIQALLNGMRATINNLGQKTRGSFLPDEKAMSLKERWWTVKKEEVEGNNGIQGSIVQRNAIFLDTVGYYRVLSVYKKSYNKWRFEDRIDLSKKKSSTETTKGKKKQSKEVAYKAHIQRLVYIHERLEETNKYEVKEKLDTYIGVA